MTKIETIDSHFHLWKLSRGDYHWLTPHDAALYRDFTLDDYRASTDPHPIIGGILVQAAATEAETDFLLSQAAADPFILGVVGWVDFDHPQAAATIHTRARTSGLLGLRPMLQDIEQRDWILHAPKAIEALIDHDVPLDALIRHDQVPIITELARRYPALRIVIDHAGKPPFSQAAMHDWQKDMTALAAHPQVVCKLSGLLTELPSPDHLELVSPALTFLSAVFGPERLIWGSDWPVLTEAGSFDQWWEITLHFLAEFPAKTRKKILRTNAEAFYVSPPKRVTKPKKAPAKEQLTITKQDHPMDKRLILLHPDDNVLVLSCDLPAKTALTVDGAVITLPHNIAIAHKMARRDIAAGDKIIKYGVPIGSSVAAIARGEHVHSHNVHSDYLPSHDRRTPAT